MNIFENATRLALRFNSPVGALSTEDLWTLPLTASATRPNLDDIARELNRRLKEVEDESFVSTTRKDAKLQLRFDVVKHIIDVKLSEQDAAKTVAANAARKQQLLDIIEKKQLGALEDKSIEDLRKELEAL